MEEVLELLTNEAEVYIIGGAEIYRAFLNRADRIYLTLVHLEADGDTLFPDFDSGAFQETSREEVYLPIHHSFMILDRKTTII